MAVYFILLIRDYLFVLFFLIISFFFNNIYLFKKLIGLIFVEQKKQIKIKYFEIKNFWK